MARLILTPEEKAAATYMEWDDAALGKFAKKLALTLRNLRNDAEGLHKITAASCAMMLVGSAIESNAAELKMNFGDFTHKGEPVGDWTITVKKRPERKLPRRGIGVDSATAPPPLRGE